MKPDSANNRVSKSVISLQVTPQAGGAGPKQPDAAQIEHIKPEPETRPQETPVIDPGNEKMSMGDLADMFSQEIVEDSESGKLAAGLNEVDVLNLVKNARDLLNTFKKPGPEDQA